MRRAIGISSYYDGQARNQETKALGKIIYLPLRQTNSQSLYKRLAKWYDANYIKWFRGIGAAIAFLVGLLILAVCFVGFARSVGWWPGW